MIKPFTYKGPTGIDRALSAEQVVAEGCRDAGTAERVAVHLFDMGLIDAEKFIELVRPRDEYRPYSEFDNR